VVNPADRRKNRRAQSDHQRRIDRSPDGPGDLKGSSWKDTLVRSVKGFSRDNLSDWAAALTYYGILSIFPMLLVLVSLLGIIGSSARSAALACAR